jgi:two-component system sensor histidine kinase KdpD
MLIRRGRRVADYLRADCYAVYVCCQAEFSSLPPAERERVEKHLNFARNLHIETRILQGKEAARTVVEFSRQNLVTQIFLARSQHWLRGSLFRRSQISRVVELAKDMRVTVIAERLRSGAIKEE